MALALFGLACPTDSAPTTQKPVGQILQERGIDVSRMEAAIQVAVENAMLSATDGTHDQRGQGSHDIRERWRIQVTLDQEDEKSEERDTEIKEAVVETQIRPFDGVVEAEDGQVTEMNNRTETEAVRSQTGCQDVADEELAETLRRIRDQDYALIHFPNFIKPVGNAERVRNYRPAKDNTCPVLTQEQKITEEVRVTSLCPWDWFQNKDESRYPRIMMFAQCECVECRQFDGTCEVAWYNVRVLRRNGTCVNGKFVYEPALEPVPVACTCDPAVRTNVSVHSMEDIQ